MNLLIVETVRRVNLEFMRLLKDTLKYLNRIWKSNKEYLFFNLSKFLIRSKL